MYVKIFTSILDSSLSEDRRLRHFFIDLLLCSDADGNVLMTNNAIGRRIGADLDEVEWGLGELQKPDPCSLSKEAEGRRIVPLEGHGYGWKIVNYERYRDIKSSEQRRRDTAERVRRWREKQKGEQLVLEPGEEKPKAASEPPANGEHARLIALWTEAFKAKFGTPYLFAKGRDGKAVKELLEAGWTPEQVMEKAREAWDVKPDHGGDDHCWNCVNRSKTLHGFREASAKIVTELAAQAKRTCL